MATSSTHDPVINIAEAASRMGVNQRRARKILTNHCITPIKTHQGIGYRLDDVMAVRRSYA